MQNIVEPEVIQRQNGLGDDSSTATLQWPWLNNVATNPQGTIDGISKVFSQIGQFVNDNPWIAGGIGVGLLLMVMNKKSR